jgi:SPP1 family predicted phage head-tail adaptor
MAQDRNILAINPGAFDRKVSFCVATTTTSAMGKPSKVYTHSFYMYMGRVQDTSGQEQFISSRLVVPTRYKYTGHYKSSVNETLQIVDEGTKYNILSVNPIERRTFIEIVVEKITE